MMIKNILILRPLLQAQSLIVPLKQQPGFNPICIPTLEIKPCLISDEQLAQLSLWQNAHWIVFTSVNAVECGIKNLGKKFFTSIAAKIVAIGPATGVALNNHGFKEVIVPGVFSSEGLVDLWPEIMGQRFLIITGKNSRHYLTDILTQRQAQFFILETYERICPLENKIILQELWQSHTIDCIIVMSAESLENLKTLLGPIFSRSLLNTKLIVLSNRLKLLAENLGFEKIIVAPENSTNGILKIFS